MLTQVVVVASPANTNAWVLHHHAPTIPAHNITCLSRLDHNRTVAQVLTSRAEQLEISAFWNDAIPSQQEGLAVIHLE